MKYFTAIIAILLFVSCKSKMHKPDIDNEARSLIIIPNKIFKSDSTQPKASQQIIIISPNNQTGKPDTAIVYTDSSQTKLLKYNEWLQIKKESKKDTLSKHKK